MAAAMTTRIGTRTAAASLPPEGADERDLVSETDSTDGPV